MRVSCQPASLTSDPPIHLMTQTHSRSRDDAAGQRLRAPGRGTERGPRGARRGAGSHAVGAACATLEGCAQTQRVQLGEAGRDAAPTFCLRVCVCVGGSARKKTSLPSLSFSKICKSRRVCPTQARFARRRHLPGLLQRNAQGRQASAAERKGGKPSHTPLNACAPPAPWPPAPHAALAGQRGVLVFLTWCRRVGGLLFTRGTASRHEPWHPPRRPTWLPGPKPWCRRWKVRDQGGVCDE